MKTDLMDALLSCVILNIMDIVTTLIDEPKNVQWDVNAQEVTYILLLR